MKYQWRVWNIHKDWQDLKAETLDQAGEELKKHLPYSEEAQVKEVSTGKVFNWRPPKPAIDFGPF